MAAQGTGSSVRPYKKASEYMAQKQGQFHSSKRTMGSLERENAELRERVLNAERKLETMEVEYDQSREYFSSQLEMTKNKLDRSNEALKRIRESYTTLQNVNYDLEQRILKVSDLEKERQRLGLSVKEVLEKLNEAHSTIKKLNEENERLRNDCSLAVSLLHCNPDQFKSQTAHIQLYRDSDSKSQQDGDAFPMNEYNEHVNPYSEELFEDNHFSDPHISGFLAPAEKGNKEPRSWKPPSHETVKNDESARKPDRETGSPWQRRPSKEESPSPWLRQSKASTDAEYSSSFLTSAGAYGAQPVDCTRLGKDNSKSKLPSHHNLANIAALSRVEKARNSDNEVTFRRVSKSSATNSPSHSDAYIAEDSSSRSERRGNETSLLIRQEKEIATEITEGRALLDTATDHATEVEDGLFDHQSDSLEATNDAILVDLQTLPESPPMFDSSPIVEAPLAPPPSMFVGNHPPPYNHPRPYQHKETIEMNDVCRVVAEEFNVESGIEDDRRKSD